MESKQLFKEKSLLTNFQHLAYINSKNVININIVNINTKNTNPPKGNEKEEYVQPLKRENGPPAERLFEERRAEGSFGTGRPNHGKSSKPSRLIPVTG